MTGPKTGPEAGHKTGPKTGPDSPVAELTSRLRRSLPDSRSGAARDLLTELEDGLSDAVRAYRSAGLDRYRAECRAVHDFTGGDPGTVQQIAASCRRQLAVSSALRSAVVVAVGFPLLLGCWALFAVLTGPAGQPTDGDSLGSGFTWVGMICAGLAVVTAVLIRRRSRSTHRPLHRLSIGYAMATLIAIAAIYLLAALNHAAPTADRAVVVGRQIVQGVSLAITLVMAWTAITTLRRSRGIRPGVG